MTAILGICLIFLMASRVYMFLFATDTTINIAAKEEWYPKINELNQESDDEPSEEAIAMDAVMMMNNPKAATANNDNNTTKSADNIRK